MLRLVFFPILFFLISLESIAQNRFDPPPNNGPVSRGRVLVRGEQIQIERIAYFTEKIGLTAEEAQMFWPVYNEMDNRRNALFEERALIIQNFMNNADNLTDRQIDEQLKRLVAIQQEDAALPVEYDAKFRKVLPARKVMNLYVAEMGFRNSLLQRMQYIREPTRTTGR